MRILQLIDTLDAGGAEKMAVNYANALSERIEFSGLIATRREGDLKKQLNNKVDFLFLNKKSTLDFNSIFKLKSYIKTNKIDFIHAHSSSFFIATCVKIVYPKVNVIWHDHNGLSEFLSKRKSLVLKLTSFFFKGILVVNYQLKNWALKELNCKKVIYLANFTKFNDTILKETLLNGVDGKRIICIANLRHQKNHFLLLEVAEKLQKTFPEWTFHCIGKDFNDDYSNKIKVIIKEKSLTNVFFYGSKNDISNCIKQASIGILTSNSEGLPVALLEYGINNIPVISTDVGEIPLIIKNGVNGFIVPSKNPQLFYKSLKELITNPTSRTSFGIALNKTIIKHNSENAVLNQYIDWINKL